LSFDLELGLLRLTRNRQQVTLGELAEQLHVSGATLVTRIKELHENGLLSWANEIIELDFVERMSLADHLIRNGCDLEKVSRSLKWQEFEDFAARSLDENGYRIFKHLVFKSRAGRRELDLLAWNDNFMLAIDCKHWSRRLSPSRVQSAVTSQIERTNLLAERPDIVAKHGLQIGERRNMLPVIITLAEPRERIVDGVPVVAVMKLLSFLYGVSPIDDSLRMITIHRQPTQSTLD